MTRQYDHADIDGKPVETGGTASNAFVPQRLGPGAKTSPMPLPATEDDQDVELPAEDHSHYGDDVERDSDA